MSSDASCNARFVGRKVLKGTLNDAGLSVVIQDLQKQRPKQNDERCNLKISDKNLHVTYIKRDEGFESDGESSSKSSTNMVVGVVQPDASAGIEVKIIKDHVFNYHDKSQASPTTSLDDTSSANSSGSDCDDIKSAGIASGATSKSTSPTADLQRYKFDHKESYPIAEVLICHTDKHNHLVWVIRNKKELEALVFECLGGEDDMRALYRRFQEVSRKTKFDVRRKKKTDTSGKSSGNVVSRSVEALFRGGQAKKASSDIGISKPVHSQVSMLMNSVPNAKWNLVQHTDRNGMTHIEVETSSESGPNSKLIVPEAPTMANFKQGKDSTTKLPPIPSLGATSRSSSSKKSMFAKELENILSKELEIRGKKPDSAKLPRPKLPAPGESLSLRQRAPALLLRKLDEFEEKAHRVWSTKDDNEKLWHKPTVSLSQQPSRLACRTPPPAKREHGNIEHRRDSQRRDRLNRIKADLMSQDLKEQKTKATAFLSSPSPPISKPSTSTTTDVATTVTATPLPSSAASTTPSMSKKDDNQILVPTKTGKEPAKKLYPKEHSLMFSGLVGSPNAGQIPGFGAHGRFIPMVPTAVQFASSTQPHSLPIFPVQVAPPVVAANAAWPPARFPNDQFNPNDPGNMNAMIQAAQWRQVAAEHHAAAVAANAAAAAAAAAVSATNTPAKSARGRSRDRSSRSEISVEQRRRAQSKSPARQRQNGASSSTRYLDLEEYSSSYSRTDLITKKFREFGDAVRLAMSGGGRGKSVNIDCSTEPMVLKSNLKKQPSSDVTTTGEVSNDTTDCSAAEIKEDKKVHFNKFATVQMME